MNKILLATLLFFSSSLFVNVDQLQALTNCNDLPFVSPIRNWGKATAYKIILCFDGRQYRVRLGEPIKVFGEYDSVQENKAVADFWLRDNGYVVIPNDFNSPQKENYRKILIPKMRKNSDLEFVTIF